jgi:hypothetical protein
MRRQIRNPNDEIRKKLESRMTKFQQEIKGEIPECGMSLEFGHSDFFSHLSFGIRHYSTAALEHANRS